MEKNRSTWAIVDGIPELRSSRDFQEYATILDQVAKDSKIKNSNIDPIVYIPSKSKKIDKHTTEQQIYGCALIAFAHKQECDKFVQHWHKHRSLIDYSDIFHVYSYNDYLELMSLPNDYKQFKLKKQDYFNERNLIWWLFDKDGKERYRDQFVLRFRGSQNEETQIFWMDDLYKSKKDPVYRGEREKANRKMMTTSYVQWSNLGYYLVTFHEKKGIKLLGGPSFIELCKLEHSFITHINFSPCDRFVVTCSAIPRGAITNNNRGGNKSDEQLKKDREDQQKREKKRDAATKIIIWDTLTGESLREFGFESIGPTIKTRHKGWWPIIQWSHDGKYFAKINSSKKMAAKPKDYDKINIYSSETMMQLDKRAHNAPSLFHMQFSPKDDLLAYSTFQNENDPASVSILKLPDKSHARPSQVLGFDIQTAHLYWQLQGKFLAIKMGHCVSKKNTRISHHSLGIIAIKKPGLPYTKSMENLGKIDYFAWEPNSSRFAIIHGHHRPGANVDVSFYDVRDNGSLKHLFKLTNKRANTIKWAPYGGRCLIAHLEDARVGVLEFVDVNSYNHYKETVIVEHQNCKEVQWDPSGRYLISAATQAISSKSSGDDTGYRIWSFQGEEIHNENIRWFYQILWRPRPPSDIINNNKEINKVKQKMGEYIPQFIKCDNEILWKHRSEKIQKNLEKLRQWDNLIGKNNNHYEFIQDIEEKQKELRSHYNIDENKEYETNTIEEEIITSFTKIKVSKEVMVKLNDGENVDFNNLDEHGYERRNNQGQNMGINMNMNMNNMNRGGPGGPGGMRPNNNNNNMGGGGGMRRGGGMRPNGDAVTTGGGGYRPQGGPRY